MIIEEEKANNWKFILIVVVLATIVGGAIWYYSIKNNEYIEDLLPQQHQVPPIPETKGTPPKVESGLYKRIQAEDYVESAERRKLRIVIELNNAEYNLPPEFGIEEGRSGDKKLIQALVYIDKILNLADESSVQFLRLPLAPIPTPMP